MKEQTCCFTGHRYLPADNIHNIRKALRQALKELIDEGIIYYGCGGARGFDLLAACTLLELKEEYPEIRLIMVYPCRNQTKYWKAEDTAIYEKIKECSDKNIYIANEYNETCMAKRNRHLVNNSSHCLCYLTRDQSGTSFTVKLAEQKGLKIINIAEK